VHALNARRLAAVSHSREFLGLSAPDEIDGEFCRRLMEINGSFWRKMREGESSGARSEGEPQPSWESNTILANSLLYIIIHYHYHVKKKLLRSVARINDSDYAIK
jgi:hypothetical protein